jgi:hypothetical protein
VVKLIEYVTIVKNPINLLIMIFHPEDPVHIGNNVRPVVNILNKEEKYIWKSKKAKIDKVYMK